MALSMFETTVVLKPRGEWRAGLTWEALMLSFSTRSVTETAIVLLAVPFSLIGKAKEEGRLRSMDDLQEGSPEGVNDEGRCTRVPLDLLFRLATERPTWTTTARLSSHLRPLEGPTLAPWLVDRQRHGYQFYMTMGQTGMAGMGDMGMPVPANWYENPPGTLAIAASTEELRRDGIDVNAPPAAAPGSPGGSRRG